MTDYKYPLRQYHSDLIRTATDVKLEEINLDAVMSGQIESGDLTISGETLRLQANIADEATFFQLAENLRRASELVSIPADDLIDIYTALRPNRCTFDELMMLADKLETQYKAKLVAALIRDASEAYRKRNLLRPEK